MPSKKNVAIIGGGGAGIMCACHLDSTIYNVTIIEKTSRLGRKLLVAGEGGFNLTFDEPLVEMIDKYIPSSFIGSSITQFSNSDLRNWLSGLGIETYVGSSSRVFPVKGVKPYEVVNAMLDRLKANEVQILNNTAWEGWTDTEELQLAKEGKEFTRKYDTVIFALGGGSWKKTGSDGLWLGKFAAKDIECIPFQPSNCSWDVLWDKDFIKEAEGKPLKNIAVTVDDQTVRGEALITADGIEGGAIYAMAYHIRKSLKNDPAKGATIEFDLKPDKDQKSIEHILSNRTKSVKHTLINKLNIDSTTYHLIHFYTSKTVYNDPHLLAAKIKKFQLIVTESGNIDKAISTVGGVALGAVDDNFQFLNMTDTYCIGEMLNWDTRTGGYLLQACFSMGVKLANHLNEMR